CNSPEMIREWLQNHQADFKGTDTQTDTYFNVQKGRLKLREGNIENNLIFYDRKNEPGLKKSHFHLLKVSDPAILKEMLIKSIGIKVIVKKKREIYYIGNVKFHIDEIAGLGSFVEIEAGNVMADISKDKLQEQCDFYRNEFDLKPEELIAESYSDMLLAATTG
ncbi:MAG TPA: class IV adenylate cyclase, partial [Chitinophagaceae bacterium]|nr:class IV adenylate cyclase [Chitinophagaceae bacterium]